MSAILDRCDVPPVAPELLALPLQTMIAAGRGLTMSVLDGTACATASTHTARNGIHRK